MIRNGLRRDLPERVHAAGIDGPRPALAATLGSGAVLGPAVLDLGCGTGEPAPARTRRGLQITGVNLPAVAIAQAGLTVREPIGASMSSGRT